MKVIAELLGMKAGGLDVSGVDSVTFGGTEIVKRGAVVNGWTFDGIVDGKARWVREGEVRESPPAVVIREEESKTT